MKSRFASFGGILAALALGLPSGAFAADKEIDLGISRGLGSRPNILVAWRNTEKILELEVLVQNRGDQVGRGEVWLELATADGGTILATEPRPVVVPGRDEGGLEGVLVQTKGFRLMNLMFDQLDRLNQRYKLRAHIRTEGSDANVLDNLAVKTMNANQQARAGMNFFRYEIQNPTEREIDGFLDIDHTALPSGWKLTAEPVSGHRVKLAPGESAVGHLIVNAPSELENGSLVDIEVALRDAQSQKVVDKDEWFLVASTTPPELSNVSASPMPNGRVMVNATAFDPVGILEASGLQVQYTTDGGTTFATMVMAYSRGNFYDETWFNAEVGPFPEGTELQMIVTAANNAGLVTRHEIESVVIPVQVSANTP